MKQKHTPWVATTLALWASIVAIGSAGQSAASLPNPLGLGDVIRLSAERRDEIEAARARARAGDARTSTVSALPDPMLAPALDHKPFLMGGADYSITIEQSFPLSGIRGHRRASAQADADRLRAEVLRTSLDVGIQAANAFLMLRERRRTNSLVTEQLALARGIVTAATARYGSGTAPQSDVLRAEVEVARLETVARSLIGEIRAAEAMLNASLAVDADQPIPPLVPTALPQPIPDWPTLRAALASRPELSTGRAEIARAAADVDVMRDMFRPMASVRTGFASTMAEGKGWMAMVGFSLPIRRDKLRAGVAEAEAMRAMSEADLRAMTRMIEGEAAAAVSQLHAARERHRSLREDVLPRTRMAIDSAIAGYTAGQLPLVSVIEAVQAAWQVQTELIVAETDLGLAWVRLGRAIGSYEGLLR